MNENLIPLVLLIVCLFIGVAVGVSIGKSSIQEEFEEYKTKAKYYEIVAEKVTELHEECMEGKSDDKRKD